MKDTELKPCPFCGGRAEPRNYVDRCVPSHSVAYVRCIECGAETTSYTDNKGNFEYMHNAIKAWNRRTSNG